MPVLVQDFIWTQTPKTVNIKIPLNSANHEKVDIFTTDSYVKVHFKPYLFEAFLLYDVDSKKSHCLIKDDLIVLDLNKKEDIHWESLEKLLDKEEKMRVRQDILVKCQEEAKQNSEDRRIRKTQLDRFTVQQAMEIDTKQHALMDARRNDERSKVMQALEEWKSNTTEIESYIPGNKDSNVVIVEVENDILNGKEVKTIEETKEAVSPRDRLQTPKKTPKSLNNMSSKKPVKSEYVDKKKEEVAKRVLPRLRETSQLEVKHTPRTFPTPSRESTAEEERVWLKNVTMARRATGFVSEDLRPEEQDPQWCKEKGDEFFRGGNYLGAISAYTHGITLSDKLPSLFANRSAAHFALGNFNKCMNDCSAALDLFKPPCESNRRNRAKCIARRAAALARVGYLSKAIDEMKAAMKLLPEDENIKNDLYNMERAWEQNPDSD
ncbi:hypothetical protein K1T71_005918 [Dendrolimus kikuchii]|uniref:Uncharacterized protein n=1 Tax=Dendrolimus kikuchii TaxID=765133 RepID=A0ACC1D2I4_9NEOP|nr:hypothetical protein K1T71_005918 [Dendrolimus kikuchii]